MHVSEQMTKMTLRPATLADAAGVADVLNAASLAEFGETATNTETVAAVFGTPGMNLARDTWVAEDAHGKLSAYGEVWRENVGRIYGTIRVAPASHGRGIEEELLARIEPRAREMAATTPEGARVVLAISAPSVEQLLHRLLPEYGFRQVRTFWRMRIEMTAPPAAPQWPEGIVPTTMAEGQERETFDALEEAFQDHWGHEPGDFGVWKHLTLGMPTADRSLAFLARTQESGEIAGIAMCALETEGGYVHQLGVRRPWRQLGLGHALLLHAFGEFYRRGTRRVSLGVDSENPTGATRLYERAGMHVIRQYDFFELVLRTSDGNGGDV